MSTLHITIAATLDGEGWEVDHSVEVPPDYRRQDIEPFIQHELDKAMNTLQRDRFGFSRSERIIRYYDRRLSLVKRLLRLAPHDVRKRPIIDRVREVIDMDGEQLLARFGDDRVLED